MNRRNFMGQLMMGSVAVWFETLFSRNKNSNLTTTSNTANMKNSILKIRPLGFQWETKDPFLFCVHHEDFFPKGNEALGPDKSYFAGRHMGQDFIVKDGFRMYHGMKVPGFPGHPHRGFETITVVRKGFVDHTDSTGASGRYGNGDVQWMTAGKGVQHAEMFPLLKKEDENPLELFQIWLNLPRKSKMVEPHFKMLWAENVPKKNIASPDGNCFLEVLVGSFNELQAEQAPPDSWAASEENAVAIYNLHMEPNASFVLPRTNGKVNRSLYFYEGNGLKIAEQEIPHYHAVDVDASVDLHIQNGAETSKILVLQGMPIEEPVVQHGPFVMNSKEEIYQAFQDYQKTQFGGWPWPSYDHVHDRAKGRFAKHSNGRVEEKS